MQARFDDQRDCNDLPFYCSNTVLRAAQTICAITGAHSWSLDFYWTAAADREKQMPMDARTSTKPPAPLDPLVVSREIDQPYHNRRIAAVNDHEVRMSVMTHGYPWHHHPDSDESFLAIDGELVIEFDAGEVVLRPGQFLTVPAGVRHRTRPAGARSVNLTFEKRGAETVFD